MSVCVAARRVLAVFLADPRICEARHRLRPQPGRVANAANPTAHKADQAFEVDPPTGGTVTNFGLVSLHSKGQTRKGDLEVNDRQPILFICIEHLSMILDWFNTREVDEFAASIASDLVARFPPSELEQQRRKGPARYRKAHDLVFSKAEDFVRTHKLNLYTKARLGSQFKAALTNAGYAPDFVDSVGYELTAFVARQALKPKNR